MTNGKDDGKNNDDSEWEFSKVGTQTRNQIPKEIAQSKEAKPGARSGTPKKEAALKLDESSAPKYKTRSTMAKELQEKEARLDEEDQFAYASLPKRGISFIIDMLFDIFLGYVIKFIAPIERAIVQLFLDKYKLQFNIPEKMVMAIIFIATSFVMIFFFIVIPVAFYNLSLGKKLLGLRIRGRERYTLSIKTAFVREVIMKPIGMIILAGFFTPFFTKDQLAIHDMVTDTFVIDD